MKTKVCVIQESPVFFDKEKTLQKVEKLTREYARQGCKLIVFPESFIPGYPRGFSFGAKVGYRTTEGRELYNKYYSNSIDLESNERIRLERISRDNNTYLVIGITEKENLSGSLYCSMIYISPESGLMGVHRKIKPTGTERLIWSEGSGDSLVTFQTRIGKLGGLICWENYMPLARMSMYTKGVEIYIAPTADSREEWTSTMIHIALEGRCFVIGCNQFFTKSMYPPEYQHLVIGEPENICNGGSIIVSPLGKVIEGPLFNESGALVAELDMDAIVQSKMDFDVIGHYSRNDIFNLSINNQPDIAKEK